MKRSIFKAVFLTAILFAGCNLNTGSIIKSENKLSAHQTRNALIGKWFGEKTGEKGEIQRWLIERKKDGTYHVEFRVLEDGKMVMAHTEIGYWGVSGPIYFTMTRGILEDGYLISTDPENAYFYDAYQIRDLTEKSFSYYSFEMKVEFEVKKVDDNFTWPESL